MKVAHVPRKKRVVMMKAMRAVCLGVAVFLICSPLLSQTANGRISGTVKDSTGGSVAGAMVTVTDVARGLVRNLTTDDAGAYLAPNLIPGTYSIRATFTGFQAWERTNVLLGVGGELAIDVVLLPGAQTQTVTITEEVPLVNATSATLGGTLSNATIVDLPLNGRNFMNLLALQPGTVILNGGAERQSTNGLRTTDNVYLIEGLANNEPYNGRSMVNNSALAGDVTTILPMDSIQEFGASANNKAELGLGPGGVVNVGVKTGTNALHGSAFAFGRGTSFNAKNFFNTPAYGGCQPNQVVNGACPLTPLGLEQWGGTAGGPIKKDKLFWFAGYEQQRYFVGQALPSTSPVVCGGGTSGCGLTAPNTKQSLTDALNSLIAAGKVVGPTEGTNIAANSLLIAGCPAAPTLGAVCTGGLFPLNMGANGTTFQPNLLSNNQSDNGVAKISYRMNDRNSFDGMFFLGNSSSVFNDAANESRAQWESLVTARTMLINGNWTWTPSSTVVNELRAGLAYSSAHYDSNDKTIPVTSYVSPSDGKNYSLNTGVTNPAYLGFPIVTIAGFSLRLGGSWPKYQGPDQSLQFLDHVSVLRGNHAFKFGGELNRLQSNAGLTSNSRGSFPFGTANNTALQEFFTGTLSTSGATVLTGNPFRIVHNYQYGLFLQDDWRIRPRLTVNLGVRYGINTVIKSNLLGNFIPNLGPIQVGQHGLTQPYQPDYKDISPRLGIAWDIFGNGNTVLSAGGSLIYSQIPYIALLGLGNSIGLGTSGTGDSTQVGGGAPTPGQGTIGFASISTPITTWNSSTVGGTSIFPAGVLSGTPSLIVCGDGLDFSKAPLLGLGPNGSAKDAATCIQPGTDAHLRSPYVSTWNLGIQRALTSKVSLHVAYVGTHGTKLLSNVDQNQPPLGAGWTGNTLGNFQALSAAQVASVAALVPGFNVPQGGTLTTLASCFDQTLIATAATLPGTGAACQPSSSSAVEQINRPYTISCPAPIGQGIGTNACLPMWRTNNMLSNVGVSNYNGLQVGVTVRPTHGISSNVAYTWSHGLDTGSSNNSVTTMADSSSPRHLNYGPSDFDYRNALNISTTYQVPDPKVGSRFLEPVLQGWALNSIITLRGGSSWSPSSGDFSGTGDGGSFWNFSGNPADFRTLGPRNASQDLNFFKPGNKAIAGADPSYAINNSACSSLAASEVGPNIPMLNGAAVSAGTAGAVMTPTSGMLSLQNLGCYVQNGSVLLPPAYGTWAQGNRGLFRGPSFKIWDFSFTKNTKITERFSAQFRAEFFNVLNHPTFALPSGANTGNPTATIFSGTSAPNQFGSIATTADTGNQSPVVGAGGARSMQLGLKLTF